MDDNRKIRITAAAITLLIALLLLLLLIFGSLTTTLAGERTWPPEHHSEIFFDVVTEEVRVPSYAAAGDNILEPYDGDGPGASDVTYEGATQLSHDPLDRAAQQGVKTEVTTSGQESPVKVKPDNRAKGNSNPADDAERAEALRRQQAEQNISDQLNTRFSGRGNGSGNPNDDGTDGTRASGGNSGGNGLGMTASASVRPSSTLLGTIVVNVTVLPDGSVRPGSASIAISRCSGNAGNDKALRDATLKAAYKCRFSRPAGQTNNLPGTITFKWE